MRLKIEPLDNPEEADALSEGIILMGLERRIAERFNVYPVRSCKAWEEFEDDEGRTHRVVHRVFGIGALGRRSDMALIYEMSLMVWSSVKRAWPEKALVMWRRFPEVSEEQLADGTWQVKLTIRLGAEEQPALDGSEALAVEGYPLPWLGPRPPKQPDDFDSRGAVFLAAPKTV